MQIPFTLKNILLAASLSLLVLAPLSNAQANSVTVSGTIFQQTAGTTFDTWKINMLNAGTFKVDVLAYEATQKQTSTAGYQEVDLNNDGEITFLDPDSYIYLDDGHLDASDMMARCDDSNGNHCPDSSNQQILTSTDGSADGSLFLRDPAFNITLAAGNYLYLVADYTLSTTEAAAGINTNDTLTLPTGLTPRDHGDYRITLSSETMNFNVSGNNINVSAVPVPAAVWMFLSGMMGLLAFGRKKNGLTE